MGRRRGKTLKALKKRAASTVALATPIPDVLEPATVPPSKKPRIENIGAPGMTINEAMAAAKKRDAAKSAPKIHARPANYVALDEIEVASTDREQYVGLDCEMVGTGINGKRSVLARACVVDYNGDILYDAFVKVDERVTDFRTEFSGVRPSNLKSKEAESFASCVTKVAALLRGKTLVGHALRNDLKVLMLSHPSMSIRDTATYRPLMRYAHGKFRPRKLKDLAKEYLKIDIQGGEHTPDEDARAAMMLYRAKRREWETNLKIFKGPSGKSARALPS
jgi:RNA exonuclease 4